MVMGISALLAAGSNLVLRHGMGGLGGGAEIADVMLRALTNPLVLGGLCGYGVSQLLWLNVLAEARLGAAFPVFVSSTFVMVMAGSILVLGEQVTAHRLGGAALVAAGIVLSEWPRRARRLERPGGEAP